MCILIVLNGAGRASRSPRSTLLRAAKAGPLRFATVVSGSARSDAYVLSIHSQSHENVQMLRVLTRVATLTVSVKHMWWVTQVRQARAHRLFWAAISEPRLDCCSSGYRHGDNHQPPS